MSRHKHLICCHCGQGIVLNKQQEFCWSETSHEFRKNEMKRIFERAIKGNDKSSKQSESNLT